MRKHLFLVIYLCSPFFNPTGSGFFIPLLYFFQLQVIQEVDHFQGQVIVVIRFHGVIEILEISIVHDPVKIIGCILPDKIDKTTGSILPGEYRIDIKGVIILVYITGKAVIFLQSPIGQQRERILYSLLCSSNGGYGY